jgi:hypothetical protein
MYGKQNWKEIMDTKEARQIRSFAEVQYKARRRSGRDRLERSAGEPANCHQPSEFALRIAGPLDPETMWWDSGLCTSLPSNRAAHEDARLVMIFLDMIHPIQFGFYDISTAMDRTWLINSLCCNEARYHAALNVSASFIGGFSEPQKTDCIGLDLEVSRRQAVVLRGLQTSIRDFEAHACIAKDMVRMGMRILEVVHQLLSLEIFSMMEGAWETHHRAAGALLSTLNTYQGPKPYDDVSPHLSPLEIALADVSSPDTLRTLEFHVTCFAWIDIIANATFGSPSNTSQHFDYIPLLRANALKIQNIMGCHSSIMAKIAEITYLADWKTSQHLGKSLSTEELATRAASLDAGLRDEISKLEQIPMPNVTNSGKDSHMVTLQFAYAARVYSHVIVNGTDIAAPELMLRVCRSVEMLESLPSRLLIRVCWPFTITGCMADETQHSKFRAIVARTAEKKELLGMSWKGLIAMEECWRLRKAHPELQADCEWKRAMKSLGKRILLV